MSRTWLLAGLLILAACAGAESPAPAGGDATAVATAAADPAAVRAIIDSANKRGAESFNSGSPDGMLVNYADDAVAMMPGMPAMVGKAAIDAGMKGMFESMEMKDFVVTTEEVVMSGDLAVERGVLTFAAGPKGGKLVADTTKYLTVWKKQGDGSWKIVRDINNSSIAPRM